MLDQKNAEEKIQSFVKYAQFVSAKFNIKVIFDGIKAETDGETITLPNLAAFNDDELDFLYGILLHEIGHVKYTNQSLELAKRIKSDAHFILANFIEDARVENLLMKEFSGAEAIFVDLYKQLNNNASLMKRVFNIEISEFNMVSALGVYLHSFLSNRRSKQNISEIFGDRSREVYEFIEKNQINTLILNHPLNSWSDSILLAEKIYEFLYKESADLSLKNDLSEVQSGIDKLVTEDLPLIQKNYDSISQDLINYQNDYADVKNKIEDFRNNKRPDLDKSVTELNCIKEKIKNIQEYSNLLDYQKDLKDKEALVDEKILKKEEKISASSSKIDILNQKPSLNDKEQLRLDRILNSLSKEKGNLQVLQNKKDVIRKEQSLVSNEIDSFPSELKEKSKDIFDSELAEYIQKHLDLDQSVKNLRNEYSELLGGLAHAKEKLQTAKTFQKNGIVGLIKEVQDKINEFNLSINIIPNFVELDGWSQANQAQMDFDQRAEQASGKIVTNGAIVNKATGKDLIFALEQAEKELKELNLLDYFKNIYNDNKIEAINRVSSKNEEHIDGAVSKVKARRHIPASTHFDTVQYKTSGNSTNLKKIKKDNERFINSLKNLFKQKMKVLKKVKFKGNQEDGSLDARSMWMLATGTDNHYFEQSHPKFLNQVAASIAIDISGSMTLSDQTENRVKELALFLSEALQSCFIKHEILGYHAPINHQMKDQSKSGIYNRNSNSLETIVYHTFGSNKNDGINNIQLQASDNSDGESLKAIGNRLLRERSKRKILFIITDGKPFLTNSDTNVLDQDLFETIQYFKNKKIEIMAIGFNDQPNEFYGNDYCKILSNEDLFNFCLKKL